MYDVKISKNMIHHDIEMFMVICMIKSYREIWSTII